MQTFRAFLAMLFGFVGLLLAVPIVMFTLPFLVVASLTRMLGSLLLPSATPWQQMIEFEPIIGWKNKANVTAHILDYVGDAFQVSTDAQGWRGKSSSIAESNVLVFGDSFAFGHAIDDAAFFAERQPHVRIKAIGANGYNMVQELLWMQRLVPHLHGKLVVWLIFLGNDLYDNLLPHLDHYRRPFVRQSQGLEPWEIVTAHIRPEKWRFPPTGRWLQRLAELCSPTFLSVRAYAACAFLIGQGHAICQQADAHLMVMTIPDVVQFKPDHLRQLLPKGHDPAAFDADLPARRIAEICDVLGVRCIDLKRYLTADDYKQYEVHWNARGHRKIASLLHDLYQEFRLQREEPLAVNGTSPRRLVSQDEMDTNVEQF